MNTTACHTAMMIHHSIRIQKKIVTMNQIQVNMKYTTLITISRMIIIKNKNLVISKSTSPFKRASISVLAVIEEEVKWNKDIPENFTLEDLAY